MRLLTGIWVRVRRDVTNDRRRFRDRSAHSLVALHQRNQCADRPRFEITMPVKS
jgi:head-tail adaptor